MFMLINYCQKRTGMNCRLYSAIRLNQNTISQFLMIFQYKLLKLKYINERNIEGLQCMVWHDNDRPKEMFWSKRK